MIELSFKNDFGQIMVYDIFLPPKIYVLPAQLGYTNVIRRACKARIFEFCLFFILGTILAEFSAIFSKNAKFWDFLRVAYMVYYDLLLWITWN